MSDVIPFRSDESAVTNTRPARRKAATPKEANERALILNDPSRSMPWDSEAEKGILSCFLNDPNLLDEAAATIRPEAFYHPMNQLLYKTMLDRRKASMPIEYIALTGYLRDANLLDKIGGVGTLSELLNFVPTPQHFGFYRKCLKSKLRLRETLNILTTGVERCYEIHEHEDVLALPGELSNQLCTLEKDDAGAVIPFSEYVAQAIERYDESNKAGGKMAGFSTGFPLIDRLTGGMQRAHNWVIGGGTSDGKTALAMNFCKHLGSQGIPSAYYFAEMKKSEFIDRWFSMESKVPTTEFMQGLPYAEDIQKVSRASLALGKLPIYLREARGWTDAQVCADVRRLARTHGVAVVFVDYVQKYRHTNKNAKTREQEVASMSVNFTTVSGEEQANVCMVLLSQVNSEGKLRESESIGFDADRALMLRKKLNKDKKSIEHKRQLDFPKVRGGRRHVHVDLDFDGSTLTFTESEEQSDPSL